MGARDTFALPDAGAIGLVGIHRRQHDRNRYARADAVARIAAQIVARIVGAEQRGQPAELALKLGASAVALAALQFLAGPDIPCISVAVRILACDAQRHVCGERRVARSEERRVGAGWVSTGKSRW